MRKIQLTSCIVFFICVTAFAQEIKEKVLCYQNDYVCYFCKKHFTYPDGFDKTLLIIPTDFSTIKNETIYGTLKIRFKKLVGMVGPLMEDTEDWKSECPEPRSNGHHKWQLIEDKSHPIYKIATLDNDNVTIK